MSGIHSKDTKPEMTVRKGLHRLGLRFRLGWKYKPQGRFLPGKPDLVFPSRQAVIFVHGCFWHGHDCRLFRWPATETARWHDKLTGNIMRDGRNRGVLLAKNWRVLDVWECKLKGRDRLPINQVLEECRQFVISDIPFGSVGQDKTVLARPTLSSIETIAVPDIPQSTSKS